MPSLTVLRSQNLNTDVSAGTAAFTSITGFTAGQLTPANTIFQKGRLIIRPAKTGVNLVINALWVGMQGGSNAFSFDGSQVQVTVGGSTSFTITVNGADFATDVFNLAIDTSKALLCAYDGASNASARDIRRLTGTTGVNVYFGGGTQGSDAHVQNKTGYSTATNICDMIAEVDGIMLKGASLGIPVLG